MDLPQNKQDEPSEQKFIKMLHHPLAMSWVLVVVLFFGILNDISGLGILAIVLAIVFFFISHDDKYCKIIKELLGKISINLEKSTSKSLIIELTKIVSQLINSKEKLTDDNKIQIQKTISDLKKIIPQESPKKQPLYSNPPPGKSK